MVLILFLLVGLALADRPGLNTRWPHTKFQLNRRTTDKQPMTYRTFALGCRNIAFQVHDPDPGINMLKFKAVHINAGNGYDVSTGKFTAPISGTYLFLVQMEVQKEGTTQSVYIEIVQAGTIIGSGYVETSASIDDGMASASAITSLSKGEQVWIAYSGAFSSTSSVQLQNSHFSGALLAEEGSFVPVVG